jgi:alanyl-tRNA synthetase
MQTAAIRQAFIDYFVSKGHKSLPSASLIPENDNTLLFNNAGMAPFKQYFLNVKAAPAKRIVASQGCLRAGGKHNDLENVGFTSRHHTFFEMLGNFSFGGYFKEEAINYAWEFLTGVLAIPGDKLWITVHQDDTQSVDLWLNKIGIEPQRLIKLDDKDNFWAMGDTGPCGPCTEIFYDHGSHITGGLPGSIDEGERYIEIWNLVFTQYNRLADGKLIELAHPCVDTGMGLERIAAVMQGVHNNYDTDLFTPLIKKTAKLANTKDLKQPSLKVVSDHIRAACTLIASDVMPSNEGRGYVLRRIIRRAIRHGHKLGINGIFFYKLADQVITSLQEVLPALSTKQKIIIQSLQDEETNFAHTLDTGLALLEKHLKQLDGDTIAGDLAFTLYDTYGFPLDLTQDIARERGLQVDVDGFNQAMARQKQRSRASDKFTSNESTLELKCKRTQFHGYDTLTNPARILAIVVDDQLVDSLDAGQSGAIIVDDTPCYATAGGQVGDSGNMLAKDGSQFTVTVTDKQQDYYWHTGSLTNGSLHVGDKVRIHVNESARNGAAANHSATHLLQAALQDVLGDNVVQKGSLVNKDYLRFDFSYTQPLTDTQLKQVSDLVNQQIIANLRVNIDDMPLDKALEQGALCLGNTNYKDRVRVVSMASKKGAFSIELCGGTHVKRSGNIGFFRITSESSIAAGIRRVEAVTGQVALDYIDQQRVQLMQLAQQCKASSITEIATKVAELKTQNKELTAKLNSTQNKLLAAQVPQFIAQAKVHDEIHMITQNIDALEPTHLRQLADNIKSQLEKVIVVLATTKADKVSVVVSVSAPVATQYPANELAQEIAGKIGGSGGGKAQMAQAGGNNIAALASALNAVELWVKQRI